MNIPLPKDPRHQRFADRILAGDNNAEAYLCAYNGEPNRGSAMSAGSRLRRRPDVIAYITAIQKNAADESTLSLLEIRRFLARIVRVPITGIDVENLTEKPNHDLIKKIKRRFDYDKDEDRTYCVEEIEKHDPLGAIDRDLKISGNDSDSNALKDLAEAISALASTSTLPTGKM